VQLHGSRLAASQGDGASSEGATPDDDFRGESGHSAGSINCYCDGALHFRVRPMQDIFQTHKTAITGGLAGC